MSTGCDGTSIRLVSRTKASPREKNSEAEELWKLTWRPFRGISVKGGEFLEPNTARMDESFSCASRDSRPDDSLILCHSQTSSQSTVIWDEDVSWTTWSGWRKTIDCAGKRKMWYGHCVRSPITAKPAASAGLSGMTHLLLAFYSEKKRMKAVTPAGSPGSRPQVHWLTAGKNRCQMFPLPPPMSTGKPKPSLSAGMREWDEQLSWRDTDPQRSRYKTHKLWLAELDELHLNILLKGMNEWMFSPSQRWL